MRKIIFLIILSFIFLAAIGYTIAVVLTPPREVPIVSATPTASPSATPSVTIEKTSVKIFMVKIADNGPVGCGDFIVPVDREISKTPAILKATIDELLSRRRSEFANTEYYSGFFSSQLKVESATITNGVAKINLTGTLSLGGVCDSPRVEEQLIQTAKQFPTVKTVELYYNNKPLKEVLSEKG